MFQVHMQTLSNTNRLTVDDGQELNIFCLVAREMITALIGGCAGDHVLIHQIAAHLISCPACQDQHKRAVDQIQERRYAR